MESSYIHEQDLREHAPLPEGGVASRTVHSDDRLRVVQFCFAAGHGLASHKAPGPVTLYFVSGKARVRAGGDEIVANQGAFLYLSPGMEHAIHAETDSVMLLTLVK